MKSIKVFAFTLLPFVLSGCCAIRPTKTVSCPDGQPVNIVCDVSKAYPVYAKTFDATLKATVKELEALEVSADASLKTAIVSLREELNNTSSRLEMRLKAAVIGLQTMPCDDASRKEFWAALKLVNEKTDELEQLLASTRSTSTPISVESIESTASILNQGFEM